MGKLFERVTAAVQDTAEKERQARIDYAAREKARAEAISAKERTDITAWMNLILPQLEDEKIAAAFEAGGHSYTIVLWRDYDNGNIAARNEQMLKRLKNYPRPEDVEYAYATPFKDHQWYSRMDFPLGQRIKQIADEGFDFMIDQEMRMESAGNGYETLDTYVKTGEYIKIRLRGPRN